MRTRTDNRDIELENLVGNLLIAQYQVERLKQRVSESLTASYKRTKRTETLFKHESNWYKISISVDQVDFDNTDESE
jgi:hypothetical protein